MVDWVHCNQCFCKPGNNHLFFLTSCGHIFCDKCFKEGQCRICRLSCSTIQLTAKMKPDVEIFFMDPLVIMKKQQKELIEQQKKLVQVIEFQEKHRQRLAAHEKKQMSNERDTQDAKMQTARQQMDRMVQLERELLCLKEENLRLKCQLSGSPGPGPGGAATPSYRSGTPGRVLASSAVPLNVRNVVQQHSSQSVTRSSSPYNRSQHMDASKMQQSPMTPVRQTPPGPARYSIRTPPINGRIGTVGTPAVGHMTRTPSGTLIRSGNTPGSVVDRTMPGRSSPMNISPASSRRGFPSFDSRSTSDRDSSSQGSLTPGSSLSSTSETNWKQIQLNYTPKRPMLQPPKEL